MAGQSAKYTALYERLSRDDGGDAESNSITNQRALLTKFAADNGFKNLREFADDGTLGPRLHVRGGRS